MPISHRLVPLVVFSTRVLFRRTLNPAGGRDHQRYRRGSALLMVLWLTAALSAIGLAVANHVRAETERTETNVDDARSYFVARGAIERAALHMIWGTQYLNGDSGPVYYVAGTPSMELAFPAAEVQVDVIPETSK